MPFSRSRSIESITRSLTDPSSAWWVEKAPDCQSIASTRVVLPWSTWATMATLRRSSRVAAGMAKALDPYAGGDPGSLRARAGAARTRRPCPRPSAGRPSAPASIATSCRPRPPSSASLDLAQPGQRLVGVADPEGDDVVEEQRRQLDRAVGVPERVGDQLADQQLGELDHRLELPTWRACCGPRRGRRTTDSTPPSSCQVPDPVGAEAGQRATRRATSSSCPAAAVQRRQDVVAERVEPGRSVLERPGRGGAARRRCRRHGTRPGRRCRAPAAHRRAPRAVTDSNGTPPTPSGAPDGWGSSSVGRPGRCSTGGGCPAVA